MKLSITTFARVLGAIAGSLCTLSAHAAPPEYCLVRRVAWCVGEGPSKVTLNVRSGFASWRVYSGLHEDRYFEIIEQSGCNRDFAPSDSKNNVRMIGVSSNTASAKISVRISKNCSLSITLPIGSHDADKDIFFLIFSAIRPCSKVECRTGALTSQRELMYGEIEQRLAEGPKQQSRSRKASQGPPISRLRQ